MEIVLSTDKNESMVLAQLFNDIFTYYQDHYSKQNDWTHFVFGNQYKEELRLKMAEIGHAPIAFNYIISAVEQGVAMISANSPSFSVVGRDDSDVKKGKAFADFISYLWYISDGNRHYKRICRDYYIRGIGFMVIFEDMNDDYGHGELKVSYEDSFNVFPDRRSKDPLYDDARNIFVSRIMPIEEFKNNYPMFADRLKDIVPTSEENTPSGEIGDAELSGSSAVVPTADTLDYDATDETYRLVFEFAKVKLLYHRVVDGNGNENIMSNDEFNEWKQAMVFAVITANGYDIVPDEMNAYRLQAQYMSMQIMASIQQVSIESLINSGYYVDNQFYMTRIKRTMMYGEQILHKEYLPISHYPIVPFYNKHVGSTLAISDVTIAYDIQEFLNKMMSLVVAHTQASTTMKLLVPRGTTNVSEIEKKWNLPWAVIDYDAAEGKPEVAINPPLSNAIFSLIQMAKHLIEYQFGIFESAMGSGDAAPNTYRGTLATDEFGQRRIKSKLQDIEFSLTRVGQVLLEWSQSFYTSQKFFRVIQPNGVAKNNTLNLFDSFEGEESIINDITVGRYDAVVLSGSTLPTNRFAEWETYKEAYAAGLIDQEEALKKSQIFDREGVLERMGKITQLSQQLNSALEEIKSLEGDLQTATRESLHDRKRVEIEKFKTRLNKIYENVASKAKETGGDLALQTQKILNEMETEVKNIEAKKGKGKETNG